MLTDTPQLKKVNSQNKRSEYFFTLNNISFIKLNL